MKYELYIIVSCKIDADSSTQTILGTYSNIENAVEKMRCDIYSKFEENKEWWEDEEDEQTIEEQYNEWIDENYIDEDYLAWIYTDDDEIEHHYQIHNATIETETVLQELYAIIRTCIDGEENNTELLGVYTSQDEAEGLLGEFESEVEMDEDDDCFLENIITIEKITL